MKKLDLDQVVAFSQSPEGRDRARALISKNDGPVYEATADAPDLIVERLPDGSARRGHWLAARFVPVSK